MAESIRFIVDLDDTLILTYGGGVPIPGAKEFVERWAASTVVLTAGAENAQFYKLEAAQLSGFRDIIVVANGPAKEPVIIAAAKQSNGIGPVMIGNHLVYDIAPAKRAGLLAIRMRHPKGKEAYRLQEPSSPHEMSDHTVSDFFELMSLPLLQFQ